jgi:hypothetical protein
MAGSGPVVTIGQGNPEAQLGACLSWRRFRRWVHGGRLSEVESDGNPSRLCERPTLESVQSLLPRPGNAMFRCSKMA